MEKQEGTDNLIVNRSNFPAIDGINGPDEDFANNVEYFIQDPEKFHKDYGPIADCLSLILGGT